jgi:hypothetical protein
MQSKAIAFGLFLPLLAGTARGQAPKLDKFVIGEPMRASARMALDPPLLQGVSLGEVAAHLAESLRGKGYAEQAWFRVSLDGSHLAGFAVLTRLERINDAGKPILQDRFSQDPFSPPVTSISDYFARLLAHASAGHYRAFLFYITVSSESSRQSVPPSVAGLDRLFVGGSRFPPTIPPGLSLSPPYSCVSYVYVWDRPQSGDVVFEENSPIDAKAHLTAAGLGKDLGLQ